MRIRGNRARERRTMVDMDGRRSFYSPVHKRWLHFYAYHALLPRCVQSSSLGAFESLKLSSDLPDRFFKKGTFSVLMYEYVPYLGWGLIRNPQVAKKAVSVFWHRLRPFHRPPMIPGSVSIS